MGKEPIDRESFTIGEQKERKKGFEISEDCIGCGKCRKICPQKCINKGTPFEINQKHCLHCGLCLENCLAKTIIRKSV